MGVGLEITLVGNMITLDIAGLMSFRAWVLGPISTPRWEVPVVVPCALNLFAVVSFLVLALAAYHPKKVNLGIEINRNIWKRVMASYKKGALRRFV